MVQRSGCDLVKLEVAAGHNRLVRRLADAGVAVMAHLGLRPQSVGLMGGYRYQGRTADEAEQVVKLAVAMEAAGAVALLIEAVPPEVSAAVVKAVGLPVIGCGAGPACHGHVVVTHDAIGLSPHVPRFVPKVGELSGPLKSAFSEYARQITSGEYPAAVHQYAMPPEQREAFMKRGGGL
jgi:3-methyl-2-oxobutanoate hydroxymethyltransferase